MGIGVIGEVLANAGRSQEGVEVARRRGVADEGARLDLEQKRLATADAQRQADVAAQVRDESSRAWADSQRSAQMANEAIRAQNEPEVITTPGSELAPESTMYRNKQTGEMYADRAKAAGVTPEKTAQSVWEQEFAGKVKDVYMRNGMPDKAAQLDEFVHSQTGRRYMNTHHEGMQLLMMGDREGAMRKFEDLYNGMVHDGRYGHFEDLGNGTSRLVVRDSRGGPPQVSQPMSDAQLGQLGAQFLSPTFLATNVLTNANKLTEMQQHFSLEVAKERIKSELGKDAKAEEIALHTRGELIKIFGKEQLDAQLGKGTHISIDPINGTTIKTTPGQPDMKLGKNGWEVIPNQQKPSLDSLKITMDALLGSTRGSNGVSSIDTGSVDVIPMEMAKRWVDAHPTEQNIAKFLETYKNQGVKSYQPPEGAAVKSYPKDAGGYPDGGGEAAPAPAAPVAAPKKNGVLPPAAPAPAPTEAPAPVLDVPVIGRTAADVNALIAKVKAKYPDQKKAGRTTGLSQESPEVQELKKLSGPEFFRRAAELLK